MNFKIKYILIVAMVLALFGCDSKTSSPVVGNNSGGTDKSTVAVLTQIGDKNSSNSSKITLSQLQSISPAIKNIDANNIAAYQIYIANHASEFSTPAKQAEIQAMVDTVNKTATPQSVSDGVLAQIVSSSSSITVEQLKAITPALTGIDSNNISSYQSYIASHTSEFSTPAKQTEIQAMIDKVNTEVATQKASDDALAQIGNEDNAKSSTITVAQLESILPKLTSINASNINEYRAFIADPAHAFSNPATQVEVQSMINTVNTAVVAQNASNAVLTQIGNEDNANSSSITATQLGVVLPKLTGVNASNIAAYRTYIADPAHAFSNPATQVEVQAMINTVNAAATAQSVSDGVLTQIGNEDNANSSSVTDTQLRAVLPILSNVTTSNISAYRAYIADSANAFSNPAKQSEVQAMINIVNSSQTVLAQIGNEHNANSSSVTLSQLGNIVPALINVNSANITDYQAYIANSANTFSNPATQTEVQNMINNVNTKKASDAVLAQIGNEDDANNSSVTATQLGDIYPSLTNVNASSIASYQNYIADPAHAFNNPATQTEVQNMINTVNTAVSSKLPSGMTIINSALTAYIVSTLDANYSVDIKGKIDMTVATNGLLVKIPYTVTGATVNLPAYTSSNFTIATTHTQNGEANIKAYLTWANMNLPVGTSTFNAYIKIDDSAGNADNIYNAKQLYIDTDQNGTLVSSFLYPVNSSGSSLGTLLLEVIPGVPDRNFNVQTNGAYEHRFLYVPVLSPITGKTWLNNNLGADYAKIGSANFNPQKQAISSTDSNAYGSLFQWGRKADGHELITWTDGTTGTAKYGNISTKSNTPSTSDFISVAGDWRVDVNSTLWQSESSINNVCPVGYRLPLNPNGADDSSNEWYQESKVFATQDASGALSSELKLAVVGYRLTNASLSALGSSVAYWTGTQNTTTTQGNVLSLIGGVLKSTDTYDKAYGFSVRCIKN